VRPVVARSKLEDVVGGGGGAEALTTRQSMRCLPMAVEWLRDVEQ
jgi:hypothetical protein